MSSQKRFGQRLKEAMTAKGLSNPDIAGALGVHTITVSKWRSGTQPVESHRVPRLAEVLGVTEAWLWGDGESVSEKPNVTLKKAFPAPVREYLAELRVRLVKAGADDEQIDEAFDLFKAPSVFAFYAGGATQPFSDEDILANVKTFAEESIIPTLRRRGLVIP